MVVVLGTLSVVEEAEALIERMSGRVSLARRIGLEKEAQSFEARLSTCRTSLQQKTR